MNTGGIGTNARHRLDRVARYSRRRAFPPGMSHARYAMHSIHESHINAIGGIHANHDTTQRSDKRIGVV